MKKILITGADSYIGVSVENWLKQWPDDYQADTLDMHGEVWKGYDFSPYDVVFHVAGIAHADTGKVSEERKALYYQINTELAAETAEKAKATGVQQFIFMSSMIVYSGCKETVITRETEPKPLNFYGDSKWQADQRIQALADDKFKIVVLRPPMIYGKGSKGNYPVLAKMAKKLPVFPKVNNQRSMLYIDNLCQFVKLMIDNGEFGVFFPQNGEYTNTSELVKLIAEVSGHGIWIVPGFGWAIKLMMKLPGKIGELAEKAFGDLRYEMGMSEYREEYRVKSLKKSVCETKFLMKNPPLVTIITVSYNSEKTIVDTIKSVLEQDYEKIEYFIIDGASTDKTVQLAEEYKDRFSNKGFAFHVISEPDEGIYDAMNKGIKLANGELIGIINSDDWYESDSVKRIVAEYQEKKYDILFGYVRMITERGNYVKKTRNRVIKTSRDFCHPSMFATREIYRRNGMYDTGVFYADLDFWLRNCKKESVIRYIPFVLANFRMGGVSNKKDLSLAKRRFADRYQVYRRNQYSKFYFMESFFMEFVKYLFA